MKKPSQYIIVSAIACIVVCITEFVTLFIFGAFYPGYDHLKDTMSTLGASVSPVAHEVSLWWVIMGLLLIFFGTGFRKAFSEKGFFARVAAWLIMLYGFGEGIGSGAFKANHIENGLTISLIFHDILGGIGVTAILLLPLIMQKVVTRNENPGFYRMSRIIFITGIITVSLFLFRYLPNENNFLTVYKGLWQRLFMLNTYIYLTTIAVLMIKKDIRQKTSAYFEN
ncbi:MAG: DUF998 domain-containing protein [Bacteroidia bacterium]|nr:DUF998 domain-containing protein [Bacteroidia bacterium]